ncbi:MAG TPA: iron-containing alcohol dehydrogenase [Candidatus Anaerostipes avistercoris]|uniref:Iron-containing alcohol dehydrogenase n=1 Tax=Candidatus Anaerostipes avistercoris TaxID=2838462 RepID=A0A9D2T893_9FIRM|nr:iron-containing alcohol dehydrogenase [Candidatus Anaerostipes avistercoris]
MANEYLTPSKIIMGEGALNQSKESLQKLGKKALIVTDDMMIKLGNIDLVQEVLDDAEIEYVIYSEINSEPCDYMIEKGAVIYQEEACDFLIALGGGSPIDSMKAIGTVVSAGGSINDYIGKIIMDDLPAMCAIPTTAGTGSEATQFTIINNTKENIKMLLKGPTLMASLAIIDPIFTMTAPPSVTAATGLDALCHAVEAYTSVKAFPMTDTVAKSAVARIFENLYVCYEDGENMEARTQMAIAALEAGIAFNNSSVTIIHGMSRPIGALYHIAHGLSNAMLLDKCLRFAVEGCPDRFCDLAKCIGVYKEGMNTEEGAGEFIKAVSELCRKLKIQTLEEYGVDKGDFYANIDKMANDAIASGSPANTRRNPTKEDIVQLYKALF